jgi:hypothetical protein
MYVFLHRSSSYVRKHGIQRSGMFIYAYMYIYTCLCKKTPSTQIFELCSRGWDSTIRWVHVCVHVYMYVLPIQISAPCSIGWDSTIAWYSCCIYVHKYTFIPSWWSCVDRYVCTYTYGYIQGMFKKVRLDVLVVLWCPYISTYMCPYISTYMCSHTSRYCAAVKILSLRVCVCLCVYVWTHILYIHVYTTHTHTHTYHTQAQAHRLSRRRCFSLM